jgi:hypothetical protein
MVNVIVSFVIGTLLLTAGMYGRVTAPVPAEAPARERVGAGAS